MAKTVKESAIKCKLQVVLGSNSSSVSREQKLRKTWSSRKELGTWININNQSFKTRQIILNGFLFLMISG
jgi:hypothetical protein